MRPCAALGRNNQLQNSLPIRKISEDDLSLVHKLIERCLINYMDVEEAASALLNQAGIHPDFTVLVWKKLEEENAEFFEPYRVRLNLKKQTEAFNVYHRQKSEPIQAQHSQQMEFMQAQHARANQNPQCSATFQTFFSTPPGVRSFHDGSTNIGNVHINKILPAARHPQVYMNSNPNERPVGMPVSYGNFSGVHEPLWNPTAAINACHAACDPSTNHLTQYMDPYTTSSSCPKQYRGDSNLSRPHLDVLQNFEGVGHNISQHSNGEDVECSEDNGVPDQMSEAGKYDS